MDQKSIAPETLLVSFMPTSVDSRKQAAIPCRRLEVITLENKSVFSARFGFDIKISFPNILTKPCVLINL